jgi:CRISPR/Cas system CSM-associated protein Csm3 (group 7 of RAMP superfamily)
MFDQLKEVVTIHVEYTTDGNLSINSGKGDGIRDNLVIREGGPNSNPVISGSSLKGVVRSTMESLLSAAGQKICVPDTCVPGGNQREKEDYWRRHRMPNRTGLGNDCHGCLVCSLFGRASRRNSQAGRVIFHDARSENGKPITPMSRTHVAITRDTKAQASAALMTVETVPADESFAGDIVLHNPDPWMVGGVLFVLENLLGKTGIGAKKTAGYGHLRVKVTGVERTTFGKGEHTQPVQKETYTKAWEELVPSQTQVVAGVAE